MKAFEASLINFLNWTKQFIIPTYQRTYSWTEKQCKQLWEDILSIWKNPDPSMSHFIGWILHISESVNFWWVMETSIIDGQQRITTCSILNAALADYIEEVIWDKDDAKVVRDLYLLNPANLWDDKHYKLKLTKLDDEKYRKLISWWDKDFSQDEPSNVIKNYRFFKESIWNFVWKDSVKVWIVKNWLAKLFIVDISLNRIQDNPQLIFESMNSTWLDLSKAELIKNFLFMDIPTQQQSELYNKYRFPMDQKLENSVNLYDQFFRDYLTFKSASWRIPTFPLLYDEFKKYKLDSKLSIEELL